MPSTLPVSGITNRIEVRLGISTHGPEKVISLALGDNSARLVSVARLGAVLPSSSASDTARFRQFRSWRDREMDLIFPSFDP